MRKDVRRRGCLITAPTDQLAALMTSHPALVDSAVRWRGVGGWGATASVMRAIDVGAVALGVREGSMSLRLVPGVATPKHQCVSGPFVEHGHVEGLSSFDRCLLSMLFDHIAHAPETDLASIAAYRNAHPLEYWKRLKEWRQAVDAEAARLQEHGRLDVTRRQLDSPRGALVDQLYDSSLPDAHWAKIACVSVIAGLDDVVVKSARSREVEHTHEAATGSSAVVRLALMHNGRRSGIDVLRRLFSPLRPSSYPPAQYEKIVLPPHRRIRVVDDGSLRLGG